MMEKTDSELVELYVRDGDRKSLDTLINRYLKIAYNFAYHTVNDKREAEDITQDSFIKVWKNIKRFDGEKKFKPWLLSAQITVSSIVLSFGVSAFIGVGFGYYPAARASSLNPIEALRYE